MILQKQGNVIHKKVGTDFPSETLGILKRR
jgi:hypothetical protein